jgi:chorismate--pyruvate lyase
MDHRQYALVRQVHLYCGDQAVVFARTIIPPQSLVGRQKRLASLGQRSLGAVLFADKTMQRSRIEVARITEKHMLHADALRYSQNRQSIWGRRSVFTLRGYPLLVSEFYLPPVLANKDRGP